MIGPYFPVPSSMDSNILQEFFMLCLKAFTAFGFRVAIVLCDGASSNLTLLKILCGCPRATLPIDDHAETLRGRYFLNMSFTNPEDPFGSPIFAVNNTPVRLEFVFNSNDSLKTKITNTEINKYELKLK